VAKAAPKVVPKGKRWLGWKSKLALAAGGVYVTARVVDRLLHPRPATELVEDLLFMEPGPRKERLVVLGTGWGAVSCLSHIDPFKYEVVCISPRNYFLMTPLLPSVTVGTVEPRTVVESIRTILPHVKFVEAECLNLDPQTKTLTCACTSGGESSSRAIDDGARVRPGFDIKYDKLLVAVGAETQTFNTPGVEKHAHFLKEIIDARRIRAAIIDSIESACNPKQSEAERSRLLRFVVVGGGPTGVEFAAELADLLHDDLCKSFPKLKDKVEIVLVEALGTVLSMFDKRISEATEATFKREKIQVRANTFVKEVKKGEVVLQPKGEKPFGLPCAVVVWATGIKPRPLISKLRASIGAAQNNTRGLLTDSSLRVKGAPDVFSVGDCATIELVKLGEHVDELWEEADADHDGRVSISDIKKLVENERGRYPQLDFIMQSGQTLSKAGFNSSQTLNKEAFKAELVAADKTLRALPATAQVASQQGKYVAQHLNLQTTQTEDFSTINFLRKILFQRGDATAPFAYHHLGSLAYIGGDSAAIDMKDTFLQQILDTFGLDVMSGQGPFLLWRSFYLSEQFSSRTKSLLLFDWVKANVFGRDLSRY
jgi:NADH:ubiquinone reductase (non-electrogenic)